jgi:integrase
MAIPNPLVPTSLHAWQRSSGITLPNQSRPTLFGSRLMTLASLPDGGMSGTLATCMRPEYSLHMNEELPLDAFGAALPPEFDDLRADMARYLAMAEKRQPSATTCVTYQRAYLRMCRRGQLPEEIGARSRGSFQLYRAAWVYAKLVLLENEWKILCSGYGDILTIRKSVIALLNDLHRYPPDHNRSQSAWRDRPAVRLVRKGKRRGLSHIPEGGLARLVAEFADDPVYADAVRVLYLTGCRPCEIANGVEVRLTTAGRLRLTIWGGKVTDLTGQPFRIIEVAIDNAPARTFASRATVGSLLVSVEDPRKLSDKVRNMSRRLFNDMKYVISPYTFRHATGAALKAQGASAEECAKALGHVSGESPRHYGTARQGGLVPGSICSVSAARPVRKTDVSQWGEVAAVVKRMGAVPVLPDKADAMPQTPKPGLAP